MEGTPKDCAEPFSFELGPLYGQSTIITVFMEENMSEFLTIFQFSQTLNFHSKSKKGVVMLLKSHTNSSDRSKYRMAILMERSNESKHYES